jgi:VanZ family protein
LKYRLFLKYWLPVLLWMALIFTGSSDSKSYQHSSWIFVPFMHWLFPHMSQEHIDDLHLVFRKSCHLTEYAVLALLTWRANRRPLKNDPRPWNWQEAGLALSIVFAYAATDELHQVFVPTRTAEISDVMIDTTGGACALLILWILGHIRKRW